MWGDKHKEHKFKERENRIMREMNTVLIYRFYVDFLDNWFEDSNDWREAMKGLLSYGLDDIEPTSEKPLINSFYKATLPTMRKYKEKYFSRITY